MPSQKHEETDEYHHFQSKVYDFCPPERSQSIKPLSLKSDYFNKIKPSLDGEMFKLKMISIQEKNMSLTTDLFYFLYIYIYFIYLMWIKQIKT